MLWYYVGQGINMTDIIIVGGGVAGLFAAISAKKNGANVIILEKNDSLGKKILITGNDVILLMKRWIVVTMCHHLMIRIDL